MLSNKVAIVTGAGGGLGREYALLFAKNGAKVVVNDLGGSVDGGSQQSSARRPADVVVDEIRKLGGDARANYDSVTENPAGIIQSAIDAFGKLDILVNNAGILRDVSFTKMTERDWDLVLAVHLGGTFKCTRAAWPYLLKSQNGRVINVASAVGIYGNFGQANYAAAKAGIIGLSKTLAIEGEKKGIKCNVVVPLAASRMTENILPPDLLKALHPQHVAPLAMYFASDACEANGAVVEVGANWMAAVRTQRSFGARYPQIPVEKIDWAAISNFNSSVEYPGSLMDSTLSVMEAGKLLLSTGTQESHVSVSKSNPPSADSASFKSNRLFDIFGSFLKEAGSDYANTLTKRVGGDYHFVVKNAKGETKTFTILLKNTAKVVEGAEGKPDCTFSLSDTDAIAVMLGKLNPQMAFMQGKMKIKGNMGKAMKFTPDVFPKLDQSDVENSSIPVSDVVKKLMSKSKL